MEVSGVFEGAEHGCWVYERRRSLPASLRNRLEMRKESGGRGAKAAEEARCDGRFGVFEGAEHGY
jgi:hypothetical protein